MDIIGYTQVGSGEEKVLVLHNWFGDCKSYDPMIPYLDAKKCTYVFMDLRGYGKSKEIRGVYSVDEAVQDAISLVDTLQWEKFHVVGHSMSGMIVQKMAVDHFSRVRSVIAITPVPACGSPAPAEIMEFLEQAALNNDMNAIEAIELGTGHRYSNLFAKKMVNHWRECSLAEARSAYLKMYAYTDFSDLVKGLETPLLVISGKYDYEGADEMQKETFLKWYPNARIQSCEGAGHYPMIETPVHLASLIEQFLQKN